MSQGSLFRPISFKTFLSQLFLILTESDIVSYADDKSLYKAHEIIDVSDETLLMSAENLFKWFMGNQMEGNTNKCHLI